MIISRLSNELASQFVARVELVASLPSDASLVVTSSSNPGAGVRLLPGGVGLPVDITERPGSAPTALVEVLDPSTPYSSLDVDVAQQVRHWKQVDEEFVLPPSTVLAWFSRRANCEWYPDACELALRSALRHRGLVN